MEEQQRPFRVVINQAVTEEKAVLARRMRRDMTPTEAKLWERLRADKLGAHFRRQQVIAGFIADFYCHRAALAVEVDGAMHNPDYDAERDRIFAARGITTLRFTNDQIERQIGLVLYQIRHHLRARQSQEI